MRRGSLIYTVLAAVWCFTTLCRGAVDVTVYDKDSSANLQQQNVYLEAFESQKNCFVTGEIPTKPRSLSFCHKFNDGACCVPGMDQEDNEMFDNLLDLGLSCRLRGDVRDHPIAKFYCMNCDPQQPRYIRNVPYTPLREDCPTGGRDQTILICRDWAAESFGTNPLLGLFNRCGVLKSSPCLGSNGLIIDNRDRYTCGDDLIIPGATYGTDDNGAALSSEDGIEAFLNADSLGPPALDEQFGFKLIAKRACSAGELGQLNPDCLRSEADFLTIRSIPAECSTNNTYFLENPDLCVEFNSELCFEGASHVVSHLWVLALLMGIVLAVSVW